MPIAVFKSVREVSTEDNIHVAANLLQQQPGKKWKTKTAGDKSAYVILELEESQQITGIDIGNEHSAFVEVFVGKAGCTREQFTEILITCSFMTPIESKNSANTNRVRCFGQNALVATALPIKWLLVKIICTQPFNKHVQYGLSFIKVHVADSIERKEPIRKSIVPEKFLQRKSSTDSNDSGARPNKLMFGLGKFALREDSPDSESEKAGGLFSRWKMSRDKSSEATLTTAAVIRDSQRRMSNNSANAKQATSTPKPSDQPARNKDKKQTVLDRNRNQLLFGDDDDEESNPRLEKQIAADKELLRKDNEKLRIDKEKKQRYNNNMSINSTAKDTASKQGTLYEKTTDSVATDERGKKRLSSPSSRPAKKIKSIDNIQCLPFNQLLKGVVLVISGIQNPDRSDLRSKALAMGAKYKGDWENGCTHLICAFKNTPKYNQVKGKGKIVTRSWIEKCYAMKKYLPWRRFALQSSELAKSESDDEIQVESKKPEPAHSDDDHPSTSHSNKELMRAGKDSTLAMYDLGCSKEDLTRKESFRDESYAISSGSDTEDEIQRAGENNLKETYAGSNKENLCNTIEETTTKDIYNESTEEEEYLNEKSKSLVCTKIFFSGVKFLISDDINVVDKIKLEKCIGQFGGALTDKLSDAQYVLSNKALNSADKAKFVGETVRPLWILECSDMESKVPTKRYII